MNRVLDKVVGSWQVNGFLTFQSGLPLNIGLVNPVMADGTQRPDLIGNPRGASIRDTVDGKGIRFNLAALSHPPDQVPGIEPRYESQVRGDGIHNLDLSIFKNLTFREEMKLQLRAEFINFTNTPRFGDPSTAFWRPRLRHYQQPGEQSQALSSGHTFFSKTVRIRPFCNILCLRRMPSEA